MNDKELNELIEIPNIINVDNIQKIIETNKYLSKENQKLQSNWNSLRGWLKEAKETSKKLNDQHWFYYKIVLDKMNELERGKNNGKS